MSYFVALILCQPFVDVVVAGSTFSCDEQYVGYSADEFWPYFLSVDVVWF